MSYSYGSRGEGVKEIQEKLNGFGYSLDVDGYYGKKTETAVKLYQKATGIQVDGICGNQTLTKMKSKLKMIVLAIKSTHSAAQPKTVQVGGVLHKVYAQGKQKQQRVYMANHGCGLCSAACAATTGGLDVTPQYLHERALALKPVKKSDDKAITIWGIVKLLNSLGVSAKWYGLPSTAAGKEAAVKRIKGALKAGKPVIITVQRGKDRLFTNSTAHTICLMGLNSKGLAVVANSNAKGPIQTVQIKSVVNRAIYGSTNQKKQLFWFGKKIYSVGYAIVGA